MANTRTTGKRRKRRPPTRVRQRQVFLMRAAVVAILLIAIILLVRGCANSMFAKVSTMRVQRNGNITTDIIETFDQDYYDRRELQQTIEDALEQYNGSAEDPKIRLEKFSANRKNAKVRLWYESYQDYMGLNNMALFNGTLEEANEAGHDMYVYLTDPDGEDSITAQELLNSGRRYYVAIISEEIAIRTQSNIRYVGSHVEVTGSKTANVTGAADTYAYVIY